MERRSNSLLLLSSRDMHKLNLNLDTLNATSFVADDAPKTSLGTVRGHADDELQQGSVYNTCGGTFDIN